jgi:hypothetical protein
MRAAVDEDDNTKVLIDPCLDAPLRAFNVCETTFGITVLGSGLNETSDAYTMQLVGHHSQQDYPLSFIQRE